MALNPEQKEKWLTALRSGEYKQGSRQLRNSDGRYCCIGVYAVCNGIEISKDGMNMLEKGSAVHYLPLQKQIGPGEVGNLWSMNDAGGKSFLEIADYIEQNL
jgi:hypothetical protein